jgi:cell division protein FtsI (penicillin-binding protein 3)
MIRTPLRPLARVLSARSKGENPDFIEAEERAKRNFHLQKKQRQRAETRLVVLAAAFFLIFGAVGVRMALLAASGPQDSPEVAGTARIAGQRADILDRNGAVLATNLATSALYAQPQQMVDPIQAAKGLVQIFPDLKEARLVKDFTGRRKFLWIKKKLSPEQIQQVQDLGEPGLQFGPREMRLYPNGRLAAHILGGASFGREGVNAAEVIGVAGVEKQFDDRLRDPELQGKPLKLSIDLSVQAATRRVLQAGMLMTKSLGASAVLLDVNTGEILSMVSLPDFDPNNRPRPLTSGDAAQSPLFNRAAQGLYELGSVFKPFTAALALEDGTTTPDTMINIRGPLKKGGFSIRDFKNYGKELSLTDVIVKSSNIGSARMAVAAGTEAQQKLLGDLGLFDKLSVELTEAHAAKPQLPDRWTELSTMTISYGHGISVTPLHLAAAYAAIVNGGYRVYPTLLANPPLSARSERVISAQTSARIRKILRAVVQRGTASFGEVEGYEVGGKTGTADKPDPKGGYYKDQVMSTFASAFPMSDPKYVLIVTLDEPNIMAYGEMRRTAGWTAVPVAAEMISRVAPLLNLRPAIAGSGQTPYTQAGN